MNDRATLRPASSFWFLPIPPPPPTVFVEVDRKGGVAIDGKAMSLGAFRGRLQGLARSAPATHVMLMILPGTDHAKVITIVDATRAAGLEVAFSMK